MVTASGTLNRRHAPMENVYGAPSLSPATSTYAVPLASACAMRWSRRRRSSWLRPSSVTGGRLQLRGAVQDVAARYQPDEEPGDDAGEVAGAGVEEGAVQVDVGGDEVHQVRGGEDDPRQRVPPAHGRLVAADEKHVDHDERGRDHVLEHRVRLVEVALDDEQVRDADQHQQHGGGAAKPRRARLVRATAG